MKQKITESQLRNMISKAITENLNELSPDYLMRTANKLSSDAIDSPRGKIDKKWRDKKVGQAAKVYQYGMKQWDDKIKADAKKIEDEIEKYKLNILSRLQDGVYVTAFLNRNSQVGAVAIHTKEDAAYEIANTKYCENGYYNYAQVKGPFNTYDEANAWINNSNLEKYHILNWDSDEFKAAIEAEKENQRNSLMLGDNFEVEPFEDEENY